ncbi:MAG: hypothetical protein LBC78_02220 [Oscillospiraceae bacterium]|jgi:hypothetical protein|nr:hypothetical protein [Oscillospiraceae bacterium]
MWLPGDEKLSQAQYDAIGAATEEWDRARAAGDKAGMELAHATAEAIRSGLGGSAGKNSYGFVSNFTPTSREVLFGALSMLGGTMMVSPNNPAAQRKSGTHLCSAFNSVRTPPNF